MLCAYSVEVLGPFKEKGEIGVTEEESLEGGTFLAIGPPPPFMSILGGGGETVHRNCCYRPAPLQLVAKPELVLADLRPHPVPYPHDPLLLIALLGGGVGRNKPNLRLGRIAGSLTQLSQPPSTTRLLSPRLVPTTDRKPAGGQRSEGLWM